MNKIANKKSNIIEDRPTIRICSDLQNRLENSINTQSREWSITVLDENRNIISDINGYAPRIPASNAKLFSTAYALDKLGPEFRLKTSLIRRFDGVLEIIGEGDPDFNLLDIKELAKSASFILNQRIKSNKEPRIILYEEPNSNWWPETWNRFDRLESYGSPITRLAITSNTLNKSIQNPIERFRLSLSKELVSTYRIQPYLESRLH